MTDQILDVAITLVNKLYIIRDQHEFISPYQRDRAELVLVNMTTPTGFTIQGNLPGAGIVIERNEDGSLVPGSVRLIEVTENDKSNLVTYLKTVIKNIDRSMVNEPPVLIITEPTEEGGRRKYKVSAAWLKWLCATTLSKEGGSELYMALQHAGRHAINIHFAEESKIGNVDFRAEPLMDPKEDVPIVFTQTIVKCL